MDDFAVSTSFPHHAGSISPRSSPRHRSLAPLDAEGRARLARAIQSRRGKIPPLRLLLDNLPPCRRRLCTAGRPSSPGMPLAGPWGPRGPLSAPQGRGCWSVLLDASSNIKSYGALSIHYILTGDLAPSGADHRPCLPSPLPSVACSSGPLLNKYMGKHQKTRSFEPKTKERK